MKTRFEKYRKNLYIEVSPNGGGDVFSYNTHVANIDYIDKQVIKLMRTSLTTTKHINYVARELNFKVIKNYT